MNEANVRGVVQTLETLVNESIYKYDYIIEGRPIRYWIEFIAGYLIAGFAFDDLPALCVILDELAPTLKSKLELELNENRNIKMGVHEND